MKKLLVLLTLIAPICVIASEEVALEPSNEPQWKDFAPPAYVNVSEPKGLGKLNETATYWYQRKVNFDNSIQECRDLEASDEKFSCYQQVKVKQYQENSDYNAKIEAMERARLGPQEMFDKTDTMLPIGGYLNNFARFQPNELRGY